uniref:Calneuron 1 n=1 Tax=Sinocyclocheilus grahami TaxID=75366 RepID=A0A672R639_SINGR
MPFHHVRAGLLYTDNYLSTSLPETSEEQLANISTEELAPEPLAVFLLGLDEGMEPPLLIVPQAQQCLMVLLVKTRERLDDLRKWRSWGGLHDGDSILLPFRVSAPVWYGSREWKEEGRVGLLGRKPLVSTPQFDMQQMSLEELKHVLFHAFRDHLTMKDIENIIVTEEESLKENSGNCQTEFQGVHSKKKNRQTCVRKSLICAFAMAFIISVMLIAANQMLRNGME